MRTTRDPVVFTPADKFVVGALKRDVLRKSILGSGACWYSAEELGAGCEFVFEPGSLAGHKWLSMDFLADGNEIPRFQLILREGEGGPGFCMSFALLNQVQARLRMPMSATAQNRWMFPREGALLKPLCWGDVVDLAKVDRIRLELHGKGPQPVQWCMSPIRVSADEPRRIDEPVMLRFPLVDEMGQSTIRQWNGKSKTVEEVTERICGQWERRESMAWPAGWSRWGGLDSVTFDATGFFRTHHDGKRWWLVDPDGHPFWSAGPCQAKADATAAVTGLRRALPAGLPEEGLTHVSYLKRNLARAFGQELWYAKWGELAAGTMRSIGFNTFANWSEWKVASAAGFPYVRPLNTAAETKTPRIFRDCPDVFHPLYEEEVNRFAKQLEETREDPAMIGYFLMNEPKWGFAAQTPAEGMLYNTDTCATRDAFTDMLSSRYASEQALSDAWGEQVTFGEIRAGRWTRHMPPGARKDLEDFSTVIVEKIYGGLSAACREVDPDHLNLGARYHTVPPLWAWDGMKKFQVFSINCYVRSTIPDELEEVSAGLGMPVMIGEWHFGAMDAGLPATGIGHVPDQAARGQIYRCFVENGASRPWCVGCHWFTLYDQSCLGRGDGECYNIGFVDICHKPYDPLASAARVTHERLYDIAQGAVEPFAEVPEFLPLVMV